MWVNFILSGLNVGAYLLNGEASEWVRALNLFAAGWCAAFGVAILLDRLDRGA